MGLRKQQKLDRSKRILEVARTRFQNEGYESVTIESIAAEAELSAVTIYNYYGTKANLLLELVKESDERLIGRLQALTDAPPENIVDGVAEFGKIMRHHATAYLAKRTWREVLAASILQGGTQFGSMYRDLDRALVGVMTKLVLSYQRRGTLCRRIDARAFADTLYQMQNIRFFLFISDDDQDLAEADTQFRRDLDVIFADKTPRSALRGLQ